MEKKGEILTQMALISDLFERANMESKDTSVIIMVSEDEFDRLFNLIIEKANLNLNKAEDRFSVKIGVVEYVFTLNKSNA
jgi:hypothetical protein